jgi:S1-C subfamily serine protease
VLAVAAGAVALAVAAPAAGAPASADVLQRGVVDVSSQLADGSNTLEGTGMVLSASGLVLTNNHVIAGAGSVVVTDVRTGRRYRADVLGTDLADDVALLRMRNASGLATVRLGRSARVAVGQAVAAVGNADGVGGRPTIATGRVTALRRALTVTDEAGQHPERLSGLIQVDAGLAPGDSGGPLMTRDGRVIGMDTAASFSIRLGGGGSAGFAIPIDRALSVARQIHAGTGSARVHVGPAARLGVEVVGVDALLEPPASAGAVVAGVVPGTPADQAGLQEGDVIVALGGRAIGSPTGLANVMQGHHPGERVALGWLDEAGRRQSAVVTLVAGPPA